MDLATILGMVAAAAAGRRLSARTAARFPPLIARAFRR